MKILVRIFYPIFLLTLLFDSVSWAQEKKCVDLMKDQEKLLGGFCGCEGVENCLEDYNTLRRDAQVNQAFEAVKTAMESVPDSQKDSRGNCLASTYPESTDPKSPLHDACVKRRAELNSLIAVKGKDMCLLKLDKIWDNGTKDSYQKLIKTLEFEAALKNCDNSVPGGNRRGKNTR